MSLGESSILMDRALVTMCPDLPESLGLYNTAKDQFSLAAVRALPLLEQVGPDSRKLALLRDWMRAYEPLEDQPLSAEISMDSLKETDKRERKERERQAQQETHARRASEGDDKNKNKKNKERARETGKNKAVKKKTPVNKKKQSRNRVTGRKRRVEMDDDVLSIDESSSSSSEASSSDSDSARKRKPTSNLPPKEVVLSSDEDDEEPNDMFDAEDPDVYEVEKIIRKKTAERYGDVDMYEVKWEGYDESNNTWEPATNISKDLIDEFEGQPVREDVYSVQEIVDRRGKRDPKTRLKIHEYKVKWVGYDELTWEPGDNLPHNLRRKFDHKYESRKRRRS